MTSERQRRCPKCRSCTVAPFLSVMPGVQPYDTVDAGRMSTGACIQSDEMETQWECSDCGARWDGEEEEETEQ